VKIYERDDLNIPKPETDRLYAPPKPDAGSTQGTRRLESRSDQIELGSQAGLLSLAQAVGSDDRATRVEQLRALVQSGRYQVDTAALSQAIVTAHLDGY
jgi:flagellar biosynthesis anti-sigma factor FlgM